METIKTNLGTFTRVLKGVVCFRDSDGNFTQRKVFLYAEVPTSEVNPKTGLTRGEESVAETAAETVFMPLFRKSNVFKQYIEGCKAEGIEI